MNKRQLQSLLKRILSQPTAPFHEYHVRDAILKELRAIPDVSWTIDAFGNVIARYRRGNKRARYAFGAHMDHPAFVRNEKGEWQFLGGVPESTVTRNAARKIEHGEFAVWDVTDFELDGDRVVARACDDLIGCVAILATFKELAKREVEADVFGVFTRAEEVGFLGAVELVKRWPLPKSVRFVSLETSTPRGGVELGKGPVLRVGDRLSVFSHEITAALEVVAGEHKIDVQRALLDGGACEATAMQAFGVESGGISLALENYHNCAGDDEIGPEAVSFADVHGLVKLLTELCAAPAGGLSPYPRVRKRLAERSRAMRGFAERSAAFFEDASDA
ncbi:M28 family peptidase [Sulfuriroseicoccus oceanibius]|uniref:M28 family peptidase n=1 Tax=Sulfuriroseicoccus oceanibius TaxID=2707525 RepID=A0A6B3L4W4_9BACT|nr:M28 family peptidase [Sulfuriroseicoccus oceanibius]QQL44660.1 M28 family peptidase [Sulfuriroseicoccus oceanibius]